MNNVAVTLLYRSVDAASHPQNFSVSAHKTDRLLCLCGGLCTSSHQISLNVMLCLDLINSVECFFCCFFIEHLSTDGKAEIREVMTLGIFLKCECIVFFK